MAVVGPRWAGWVGDSVHHSVTGAQKRALGQKPIAILIGGATASSGEASVISFLGQQHVRLFGSRTRGLATVNQPFELSSGAVLMLTTAHFADRTGRTYPRGIEPDAPVAGDLGQAGEDPCLHAAVTWLVHR